MSADPQMMAQMLASQLGGQQAPVGGMQPQAGPVGAAGQLAQKIMLMRALQQGQPQPGQPPPPQPNMMGQVAAQPQAMQAQPLSGGVNA